jgi:hypothetical protein
MGGDFFDYYRIKWPQRVCWTFLLLTLCGSLAQAAGESILLPGYEQPQNLAPAIGAVSPPALLPGWSTPGPGFVPHRNPSGLKLIVDNSWPDLPGYRMVRIEFLANKPLIEERRLRIQLKFRNYNYGRAEMSVTSEEIVIPAGQTGVKSQILFPSEGQLSLYDIRTTEDGEVWPDLTCTTYFGQPNTNSLAYLDLTGLEAKASAKLTNLYLNGMTGISSTSSPASQGMTQEYRNGMIYSYPVNYGWSGLQKLGDLPTNPLGYDCFKVVLIRAEQLTTLQKDHSPQWNALCGWVATGGTLLIWPELLNDAASRRDTQKKLDELFPQGGTPKDSPRASWHKESINAVPEPLQNNRQRVYYQDDYMIETKQSYPSVIPQPSNSPGIDYQVRSWFQGTLAVLPDDQYFDTIYAHLQNASPQPLPNTPLPKVGLPPITMFQVLITLFVVLIGPVNYFYFKNRKKLNWLLITVPAGALAITGLLLSYTLYKDGIGVRTWSQSYTILDQIQKQAATRQQFTLFAGITPGDGLRFRDQTNLSDLAPELASNYSYRYRDTRNWDYGWDEPADGSSGVADQHFRTGWLPARTLKLYETREFSKCHQALNIVVSGDECQLTNKLGSRILSVTIVDGERAWTHDTLEPDASGNAKLHDEAQFSQLKSTVEQDLYVTPLSFDADQRIALPPHDKTLIENFLGRSQLNRRIYLAVVERWPELESGVTNPSVEAWGPHIILGVW